MTKTASNTPVIADSPIGDRIISAAFKAFMANGYAGTSTLEIATRAKVSKRDLYAQFANKRAILLACIARRAARMRLAPDLPAPQSREMLSAVLTAFGATVLREGSQPDVIAMHRLAIAEARRSPDVAETLSGIRSANRAALAEFLARSQAAGILGHGDPAQMTEQFFALIWGDLLLDRLLDVAAIPKPADIERRARHASAALLKLHGMPAAPTHP